MQTNRDLSLAAGDMAPYLDMYGRYNRDPASVPIDWRLYFEGIDGFAPPQSGAATPALWELVQQTLTAYRVWGHLQADLDPLNLRERFEHPQITKLRSRLLRLAEVTTDFGGILGLQTTTVRNLLDRLHNVYGGHVGAEFAHLCEEEPRSWLEREFEAAMLEPLSANDRRSVLDTIIAADEFEAFFRTRFPTKKRFGVEGAESFLVFLNGAAEAAANEGFAEVVIGGMHRGRLNMLANVFGKPATEILAEAKDRDLYVEVEGQVGDVPYHLGYSGERLFNGRRLRFSISPHPSHLMAVAPVVVGRVRGKRAHRAPESDDVLSMLLHTDAAFCGQGVTAELLQLGGLPGFSVGGTVHCILNNQLGFTTKPSEGRTARYCTDIGKMVEAPIFHVNGNNPEAVLRVSRLALKWRREFRRDVLVDLVCYRRNGHNELDEPRFTQPLMYEAIDATPSLKSLYMQVLAQDGADIESRASSVSRQRRMELDRAYEQISNYRPNAPRWRTARWTGIAVAGEAQMFEPVETGVPCDSLREVGHAISQVPAGMAVHPKVTQFQKARLSTILEGEGINWATAEALAIGTLLSEGVPIRISGQDTVRGTFTQRHWELHDRETGGTFIPLQHVKGGAECEPINSPLSEYAVLAFEYGHSLSDPNRLVMWEAQFGDFVNGAQIVVDQFIAAGEAKWLRMSGLVMLLPHGPEGQGPEHSSARIERFLQLCANGNMFVANCSTPANFFHVLRRQIKAPYRKPLVVMTPKSLLRNKSCVSRLEDMGEGTRFAPVLGDSRTRGTAETITRVVMCSGKIFYDLDRRRLELPDTTALVRLEQIYPFPSQALAMELALYPEAELIWCQEEPENQGVWEFLRGRFIDEVATLIGRDGAPRCVARKAISSPAGGSFERHVNELVSLIERALQGP
jgi:2-oxoglutarate dehydrogenase E1 component